MTAPALGLSPAELGRRTGERQREHPLGVLPLFVVVTDFAPVDAGRTPRSAGSRR